MKLLIGMNRDNNRENVREYIASDNKEKRRGVELVIRRESPTFTMSELHPTSSTITKRLFCITNASQRVRTNYCRFDL